jgi:hypothetical protein
VTSRMLPQRLPACGVAVLALVLIGTLHAPFVHAASDEIQVYLDDVDARGERSVELHMNYVPRGRLDPDYPGEQPPGHILRVTPEFSFGLGENWDWGLYLPFAANKDTHSLFADGFKLRLKHVINTERQGGSDFYGANLEVARASRRTSPSYWRAELRGMLGMRRGEWLVAMNPILSTPLSSSVAENTVDLELAFKVGREVRQGIALGVEHYSELGPVSKPVFGPGSAQTTFAILDWAGKKYDLNFGIGHGWTEASDKRVIKAILGLPF